jgi:predicted site-specific integrase-resolvase
MNTYEIAKKLGISQPRVSKYIKDGTLKKSVKKNGRRYDIDLKAAKKELGKNLDQGRKIKARIAGSPAASGREETESQAVAKSKDGLDFQTARSVNEQYKAALKKLEFDERKGKLVNIDEIKRIGFEAAKQFKEHAMAIPERCAAILAVTDDQEECKRILQKEIRIILENLSDSLKGIV